MVNMPEIIAALLTDTSTRSKICIKKILWKTAVLYEETCVCLDKHEFNLDADVDLPMDMSYLFILSCAYRQMTLFSVLQHIK